MDIVPTLLISLLSIFREMVVVGHSAKFAANITTLLSITIIFFINPPNLLLTINLYDCFSFHYLVMAINSWTH